MHRDTDEQHILARLLSTHDPRVDVASIRMRAEIAANEQWLRERLVDVVPPQLVHRLCNHVKRHTKRASARTVRWPWAIGVLAAAALIAFVMFAQYPVPNDGTPFDAFVESLQSAAPVDDWTQDSTYDVSLADLESALTGADTDWFDDEISDLADDIDGLIWNYVSNADDDWPS